MAEINFDEIPESRKIYSWAELVEYCGGHAGSGMEDETIYIMNDIDVYAEYPNDDAPALQVTGINIDGLNHTIFNLAFNNKGPNSEVIRVSDNVEYWIKDLTFRNLRPCSVSNTNTSVFIFYNNHTDNKTFKFKNVGFYGDLRKCNYFCKSRETSANYKDTSKIFDNCHMDILIDNMEYFTNSYYITFEKCHLVLRFNGNASYKDSTVFKSVFLYTRIDFYNLSNSFYYDSSKGLMFPSNSNRDNDNLLLYIHSDVKNVGICYGNGATGPIAYVPVGEIEGTIFCYDPSSSYAANFHIAQNKTEAASVEWLTANGFLAAVKE